MGNKALRQRLRFRALYRAPNRFALLVSDPADGTPLVFCSDRKMFLYDPVSPTLFYSENASFSLRLLSTKGNLSFSYTYLLYSSRNHDISLDLRSVVRS